MNLSLQSHGLLDPRQFEVWRREKWLQLHKAVALGMQDGAARIVPRLRMRAAAAFQVRSKGFLNTISGRVHAVNKLRLPVVDFYSRIPWMGIHGRGGAITSKGGGLLIPLLEEGKRMGPKAFRRVITAILNNGAGFFKEVNGKVILFAEYQPEYGRALGRFRRAERFVRGGQNPRAGESIPIAVLVKRVELKKRYDLTDIVRQDLGVIARFIESRVAASG
jgi:hypothetical protein